MCLPKIPRWMYIKLSLFLDKYSSTHVDLTDLLFLQYFEPAIKTINFSYIFKTACEHMPKWSKLLRMCCTLLVSRTNTLQVWGYHMLTLLIPGFIEIDTVAVKTNTPHEKGLIFERFKDSLLNIQEIVQTLLLDFK